MVTDAGEGIDPKVLPYLFEEFVHQEINHHSEGHGLSLAIARQVVLAHNGVIGAENVQPGETTFTVQIPATAFDASTRAATGTEHDETLASPAYT